MGYKLRIQYKTHPLLDLNDLNQNLHQQARNGARHTGRERARHDGFAAQLDYLGTSRRRHRSQSSNHNSQTAEISKTAHCI